MTFEGVQVRSDVEIGPADLPTYADRLHREIARHMELFGVAPARILIKHDVFFVESMAVDFLYLPPI